MHMAEREWVFKASAPYMPSAFGDTADVCGGAPRWVYIRVCFSLAPLIIPQPKIIINARAEGAERQLHTEAESGAKAAHGL